MVWETHLQVNRMQLPSEWASNPRYVKIYFGCVYRQEFSLSGVALYDSGSHSASSVWGHSKQLWYHTKTIWLERTYWLKDDYSAYRYQDSLCWEEVSAWLSSHSPSLSFWSSASSMWWSPFKKIISSEPEEIPLWTSSAQSLWRVLLLSLLLGKPFWHPFFFSTASCCRAISQDFSNTRKTAHCCRRAPYFHWVSQLYPPFASHSFFKVSKTIPPPLYRAVAELFLSKYPCISLCF